MTRSIGACPPHCSGGKERGAEGRQRLIQNSHAIAIQYAPCEGADLLIAMRHAPRAMRGCRAPAHSHASCASSHPPAACLAVRIGGIRVLVTAAAAGGAFPTLALRFLPVALVGLLVVHLLGRAPACPKVESGHHACMHEAGRPTREVARLYGRAFHLLVAGPSLSDDGESDSGSGDSAFRFRRPAPISFDQDIMLLIKE